MLSPAFGFAGRLASPAAGHSAVLRVGARRRRGHTHANKGGSSPAARSTAHPQESLRNARPRGKGEEAAARCSKSKEKGVRAASSPEQRRRIGRTCWHSAPHNRRPSAAVAGFPSASARRRKRCSRSGFALVHDDAEPVDGARKAAQAKGSGNARRTRDGVKNNAKEVPVERRHCLRLPLAAVTKCH